MYCELKITEVNMDYVPCAIDTKASGERRRNAPGVCSEVNSVGRNKRDRFHRSKQSSQSIFLMQFLNLFYGQKVGVSWLWVFSRIILNSASMIPPHRNFHVDSFAL